MTGNFVTSTANRPDLYADTTSSVLAAAFLFNVTSRGSIFSSKLTSQFIVADASGSYALSAARTVASIWESYVIQLISGSSDTYTIFAKANQQYIQLGPGNALYPTAANCSSAANFKFIAPGTAALPTGSFTLQEINSGNYVTSMESRTDLYVDAVSNRQAIPFTLATVSAIGSTSSMLNAVTVRTVLGHECARLFPDVLLAEQVRVCRFIWQLPVILHEDYCELLRAVRLHPEGWYYEPVLYSSTVKREVHQAHQYQRSHPCGRFARLCVDIPSCGAASASSEDRRVHAAVR